MLTAGRNLKKFYPSLKHVTCLAHALNLVAEEARAQFELANKMIASMKTIFKKCVRRRIKFREVTNLRHPPKVVVTRWCTWIIAAIYYNDYYDEILPFINQLDGTESVACGILKKIFPSGRLREQLLEASKFKFLIDAIEKLQDPHLTSQEQIDIVETVRGKLTGNLKKKLDESLAKNPDFKDFNKFEGQSQLTIKNQIIVPLVSVEVERSFSKHKAILAPNRERFTAENLSKYTVINFNSFLFSD